jgi:hypothetical protein
MGSWGLPKGGTASVRFGVGRLPLILLTAWSIAMIVPAFQRIFDELGSLGITVDNDGVVTSVVSPFRSAGESPAAISGIVPGDRLDLRAMRCIPVASPQCFSLVAVLGGSGGMQAVLPNRQATLVIRPASGGAARAVTLRAVPSPLTWPERVVLLADTIVGVIVIAVAFWLVWTRPGWMTWGLFLYVIWFNPGQSLAYYAILQLWPGAVLVQEVAESLATGAAFAGLVLFALRFPQDRTEPNWQPLEWALPWLAAGLAVLTLLGFGNMVGFPTGKIVAAGYITGYVVDVAVLAILLLRRRSLGPADEQRMRWVIWGCAIGLPVYILAEICQSMALPSNLWRFSPPQVWVGLLYLPNGVLAYFASQAVWQRRVVSVSIPLRHGTIISALSLAVAVPLVYLHEKLSRFGDLPGLPWWIWPLVVAPVLLLLVHRLHEIAIELTDRVFNRRFHTARKRLEALSKTMLKAATLEEMDRAFVEGIVQAFSLSSGAIFRNEHSAFRRAVESPGWNDSMRKELRGESDGFLLNCLQDGKPFRLPEAQWEWLSLPTGVKAPCLAVPIRGAVPEATAVALFGPHETGNDIDPDECEMLRRSGQRAARAYERLITKMLRKEVAELRAHIAQIQNHGKRGS